MPDQELIQNSKRLNSLKEQTQILREISPHKLKTIPGKPDTPLRKSSNTQVVNDEISSSKTYSVKRNRSINKSTYEII